MSFLQSIVIYFIAPAIGAYVFIIFLYVIMGWLASFNVINLRNPNVYPIYMILERVSNYVLRPIRKVLPPFGGLDFSPVVALFGLYWFRDYVLLQLLFPMLG